MEVISLKWPVFTTNRGQMPEQAGGEMGLKSSKDAGTHSLGATNVKVTSRRVIVYN